MEGYVSHPVSPRQRRNDAFTMYVPWKSLKHPDTDLQTDVDANWAQTLRQGSDINHELARYEQFLRRELPDAVRAELQTVVEREFPFEERVISALIEIVRDQQLRLFQVYAHLRSAGTDPLEQYTSVVTEPSVEHAMQATTQTNIDIIHGNHPPPADTTLDQVLNDLAPYNAPPYLNESLVADIDAILFDIPDCSERVEHFEDSAYGSGSTVTLDREWGVNETQEALYACNRTFFDNGEEISGFTS